MWKFKDTVQDFIAYKNHLLQWFLRDKADNGKNDSATLYKFRADYHFTMGNIAEAVSCYRASHGKQLLQELMLSTSSYMCICYYSQLILLITQ